MVKTALVVIFDGCEDVEAATSIDVLRRGKIDVKVASLEASQTVKTASKMIWASDCLLTDIAANEQFDAVILPGGSGTFQILSRMEEPEDDWAPSLRRLKEMLVEQAARRDIIGAICAAPLIIGHLGLLKDATCCCYPACADRLMAMPNPPKTIRDDVDAVTYGTIVTSRGPATAQVFAHSVLASLAGAEAANSVSEDMLARIRSE